MFVPTVRDIRARLRFWATADRIGPDIPTSHWRLYFRTTALALCKEKFKDFADTAEVRPGSYVIYPSMISIGARVVIRPGTMLMADDFAGISIEDDVLMGSGIHVYSNDHAFDDPLVPIIDQGYSPSLPVKIERGSWIGANAIILKGVVVGENSVVGAGAVVTKSVPPRSVAVGSPARVVRTIGSPGDVEIARAALRDSPPRPR